MPELVVDPHIELMQNPDKWAFGSVLPVRRGDRGGYSMGFMLAHVEGTVRVVDPIVYLGRFLDALNVNRIPELKAFHFDSFQALRAAGWQVDL
jgi:hypothetical protein